MIKIEKYTGTKTYMYPNGEIATPERVKNDYPAVEYFTHIIEVSGNVFCAIDELSSARDRYDIDEALSEDEVILAIQTIRNTTLPTPSNEPTAEERIAAAMEFQNLMSL